MRAKCFSRLFSQAKFLAKYAIFSQKFSLVSLLNFNGRDFFDILGLDYDCGSVFWFPAKF